MGYGVPAAIGAKVACPEKIVVDIDGDGSFSMTCMELATAVENNINVKVSGLCASPVLAILNGIAAYHYFTLHFLAARFRGREQRQCKVEYCSSLYNNSHVVRVNVKSNIRMYFTCH